MNNKREFIVGVVLIAASIAVAVRYFYLREHLESITESVFFLRFAFILFSLVLAGAGVKKIILSKQQNSSDNKEKSQN